MNREQALNTIFHLTPPNHRSVSSRGNRWIKLCGDEWVELDSLSDEQIRDRLPAHHRAEYTGEQE